MKSKSLKIKSWIVYGKKDKQFVNLNGILQQITGFKPAKDKKNPDEDSISTSQQSYAALTQTFSDLIATIGTLNPAYTPTNEAITLPKLQEKYEAIENANTAVTTSYNTLTDARKMRDDLYATLKTRLQRIKKTVQSQYGNTSAEYVKIKGYKI
jgi:chromosome segregation ATPase